jgi:ADP-heptose:LPS heptosyltransferase
VLFKPKTLVYLRPDTIGDLVLFTSTLGQLMAEWPDARHVLVIRQGYEGLAPLFPKALEWKVAWLNPFKQRPSECRKELTTLLAELEGMSPDLILAPTLNRTWLEIAVAAHFRGVRSVVLGGANVDPIFAASLKIDLGVDPAAAFKETVAADPAAGDVENQQAFAEYLVGRKLEPRLPAVEVSKETSASARSVAAKLGLSEGKWAAVFAGGVANVSVKAWPTERFAEVVVWLQARKIPVLLLAHESEAALVEQVAEGAAKLGVSRPKSWLGKDGELPLLAALLKESLLYVGNDTGAMHMAGAVGRPVVGIFGGGHWPRFRPSAAQAVSVVQPLPCFGCNWDCHFGDGPCVKTIPAFDVIQGIERVLGAGTRPLNAVVESHALSPESVELIAKLTPGVLALKRSRVDRQHKIEELKAETDFKDTEIADLKRAAEERKTEMESIKAELEEECADKTKEIEEKDVEIADLKRAAEERKTEMESIKAELEEECAEKDKEIAELKAEADTKDTEIGELKAVCNEREALIIKLDGHIKDFQKSAAGTQAHVANLEAEKARIAAILAKLPEDAETWSTAFGHKDVHIFNIEATLRSREEEVAALKAAVANYASGYAGLEQAKHYGLLLAQKEAVIRDLHRICLERDAVIQTLAAGGTVPREGLGARWAAFSHNVHEKVWKRARRWLHQKVISEHWMQIGTLRQYEPRPIQWDRRLAKAGVPDADLPTMGIVTPSYGQHKFVESTMLSVLNQNYPKLLYVVQDGASPDSSPEIIARYASRLRHWQSAPDSGQADAIRRGFSQIEAELLPTDVMAWFNSDDLVAPRALRFVASYFARHPDVDVVYGHRIIIDDADRDVGRWIMPRHDPASLEWIDYVPQETLFWRKRAWDLAGGIDPTFQFALDWDLLARFHAAGCRIVRLPYFLGCFRVHPEQKTSHAIHTTGAEEMSRIRRRFHGAGEDDPAMIERHARGTRTRGVLTARLLASGIRW